MYETVIIPYWQKESPKQLEARDQRRKDEREKNWSRMRAETKSEQFGLFKLDCSEDG